MKLKKRIISALLVLALFLGVFYAGNEVKEQEQQSVFDNTRTLHIWYTDESMTDFLSAMAVKYNEEKGVRVIPVLQSGLELLEKINEASLTTDSVPDLYIASHDNMEKAYLAGLAMEVELPEGEVLEEHFPESAIHAVTYQNKILGYPFYYETSALLYNMTYLEDLAELQIREEMGVEVEGEEEEITEEENKEESEESSEEESNENQVKTITREYMDDLVHERVPSLIPQTFDDLLEFAEEYNAPANVEAVFKWDVSDIFYNYFFVGNYIDMGGVSGDSTYSIDIYNEDAIKALKLYQDLNEYFAIDADDVAYASVIQEFMEGKIVMTTATTDVIRKLESAKEAGEFTYDYGIATIPNLNKDMESQGMSITNTIYINGYTHMKEAANDFARYLVEEHADELYAATGKAPAHKNVAYDNANLDMFLDEYQDSMPMPKMMTTSNFWVKMEMMFDNIWNGADVSSELKLLSEEIMTQVTGEVYEESYIEVKEEEEGFVDYSDD